MSVMQNEQLSDDMNRYYDQFMDVMKTLGENSPEYTKSFGEFVKAGKKWCFIFKVQGIDLCGFECCNSMPILCCLSR